MKEIVFVGGMPRSGSTLLQAILDQNPEFHAWITSGLAEVLVSTRNNWDNFVEHRAANFNDITEKKRQVLRAIIDGYYNEVSQPYVFDKSRAWLAHIELLEWVLEKKVKILVPVRDLREILASFELLWRDTTKEMPTPQEINHYLDMQTVAGRCEVWVRANEPIGLSYNRITDAIRRGYRDRMYFVKYEDLCYDPRTTMQGIYAWLGVEPYQHDFNNVVKQYEEDDRAHGFLRLHNIRPKVTPTIAKANGVLGADIAKKYTGDYVWDTH